MNLRDGDLGSAVILLEFCHEGDQFFDAFNGHGVIDGCAHTADEAMTFENISIPTKGYVVM